MLPRLPIPMRILAILSLCMGLWGAMSSLAEVNGALLLDRKDFVLRVRDRQLMLFDQMQSQMQAQQPQPSQQQKSPDGGSPSPDAGVASSAPPVAPPQGPEDASGKLLRPFIGPFLKLQRAEAERLSLLLGDTLYERRGVTVPLGFLQLILCWLLISGSLATFRRQAWGVSTWSFACWASISFALLSMLVTFVHSRTLMYRLGQPVAEALAHASGLSVEVETASLWQLTRLFVVLRAAIEGFWVLLLGLTALYLQRYLLHVERHRDRSTR